MGGATDIGDAAEPMRPPAVSAWGWRCGWRAREWPSCSLLLDPLPEPEAFAAADFLFRRLFSLFAASSSASSSAFWA